MLLLLPSPLREGKGRRSYRNVDPGLGREPPDPITPGIDTLRHVPVAQ